MGRGSNGLGPLNSHKVAGASAKPKIVPDQAQHNRRARWSFGHKIAMSVAEKKEAPRSSRGNVLLCGGEEL